MARVNHKIIRQQLDETKSKITDRQFFTSRILSGHFEDIAIVQSRRYSYDRQVHVRIEWAPKDPNTAYTDDHLVWINAGNSIVTAVKGRAARYQLVCGLFTHEFGHVLFTDFLMQLPYERALAGYRWFPEFSKELSASDIANEKDFWKYVKSDEKNLQVVIQISRYISNILEDGYVENRMLSKFPGTLGQGLRALREVHFNALSTVTQLKEREAAGEGHIFESISQLILSYVKFGEIKYGEESLSDERIQTVFGLINELDTAVMTHSSKKRYEIVNLIMIRCWPYLKSFCEQIKEAQDASGTLDAEEDIAEMLKKIFSESAGGSAVAKGISAPVPEGEEEKSERIPCAGKREKTKAEAESAKSEGLEKEAPEKTEDREPKSEGDSTTIGESDSGESGSMPTTPGINSGHGGKDESDKEEKEEDHRLPYVHTDSVSAPIGGMVERDEEYSAEATERAASEIESLLEKIAEHEACAQLEGERIRELNEAAMKISYGNVHAGVNITIHRMKEVGESFVELYNRSAPPLLNISKQLQRSLVRQLNDKRRGWKNTGLFLGRKLDVRSLHRNDGKVFYKNNLPQEAPQLAVGLLLDESGSMYGHSRDTYARAAAIILYDFCRSLDIPIMVYGHSTEYTRNGEGVALYSYAEFEDIDGNDRYRMMDIRARDNNRDGAALRFVADRLSKREEDVKLLILVSDGQPAASGYYGSAAEEDLRGVQHEYQKKGILFVAAAIGDDKTAIERIYGDSFMDITDLKQLPVKLTSVVKRHIRV